MNQSGSKSILSTTHLFIFSEHQILPHIQSVMSTQLPCISILRPLWLKTHFPVIFIYTLSWMYHVLRYTFLTFPSKNYFHHSLWFLPPKVLSLFPFTSVCFSIEYSTLQVNQALLSTDKFDDDASFISALLPSITTDWP